MQFVDKVRFENTGDFSQALKPLIASQLITPTSTGFLAELSHRRVNHHLDLLWGNYRGFSGILMPNKHHVFTIELGDHSYLQNGHLIDCQNDELVMSIAAKDKSYDLVIKQSQKPLQLIVDPVHFAYLYEKLTDRPVEDFLNKPIAKFKSQAHKKTLLSAVGPFLQNNPQGEPVESATVDLIIEAFIEGLDPFVLNRNLSYCRNIALKAHELIIATPHKKISLSEICEILGVASRSLQQGFKEIYGMGFIEYHRIYRLHRLRKYIKKNGLKSGDLTDLIGMYGFDHAGRFSQEYKKAFAILPSKDPKDADTANPLIKSL